MDHSRIELRVQQALKLEEARVVRLRKLYHLFFEVLEEFIGNLALSKLVQAVSEPECHHDEKDHWLW